MESKLTQLVGLKSSMATNAKPRGSGFHRKVVYIKVYTVNGLTNDLHGKKGTLRQKGEKVGHQATYRKQLTSSSMTVVDSLS